MARVWKRSMCVDGRSQTLSFNECTRCANGCLRVSRVLAGGRCSCPRTCPSPHPTRTRIYRRAGPSRRFLLRRVRTIRAGIRRVDGATTAATTCSCDDFEHEHRPTRPELAPPQVIVIGPTTPGSRSTVKRGRKPLARPTALGVARTDLRGPRTSVYPIVGPYFVRTNARLRGSGGAARTYRRGDHAIAHKSEALMGVRSVTDSRPDPDRPR